MGDVGLWGAERAEGRGKETPPVGFVCVLRQVWFSSITLEQEGGNWAGVGAPFLSPLHLLRPGQQQLEQLSL